MQAADSALAAAGNIIHDTVANKKYKCFFHKCRKSYFTIQLLISHQKIHVKKSSYMGYSNPRDLSLALWKAARNLS